MTLINGVSSYTAQIALQQQAQGQRQAQEQNDQQQKLNQTNDTSATAKREALFRAILENGPQSDSRQNVQAQGRKDVLSEPSQGRGAVIDIVV